MKTPLTILGLFFVSLSALAQEHPQFHGPILRYRGYEFNTQKAATGIPADPSVKNYVMGPLEPITDWDKFAAALKTLKQSGVEAITTDVWWGLVEPKKGQFDWTYYQRYAEIVRSSGLSWLPILSFHQAGGNVGDNVNIPLPSWVWKESSDMKFVGSNGYVNGEYISFWTPEAYPLYEAVMKSFAKNFSSFNDTIAKIYLSLGPAGELRFPSYNAAAGWNYPDIGYLQSYSEKAKKAFREFLQVRYQNKIQSLNSSWGLEFNGFDDTRINPPMDGVEFFRGGVGSNYGKDFLDFYQTTLEKHARKMFELGQIHLRNSFFSEAAFKAPLGGKIAGIHWKMTDPVFPRAAERAAGYNNYESLIKVFNQGQVDLTFTCMEMHNNNSFPMFSEPERLVAEVINLARNYGVRVNGENALAISNNPAAYNQIKQVLERSQLAGFTLLRLGQIVDSEGQAFAEIKGYKDQVIRGRHQHFLVRTNLNAKEIADKGYEVRLIGNTLNLGSENPAKGLALTPDFQGDWVGSTDLPKPEGINFRAILYNPKTGDVIHELDGLRHFKAQSDHLFVNVFFGHVITMGPMIPLKTSDLSLRCQKIFGK